MLIGTMLFVCLGGVKAQTTGNKVGEQDFTSLESLPNWHTQNCTATLEGEAPSKHMDVTRNEGVTASYNAQKMVADGISTIVGGAYTVKLRIKGSIEGDNYDVVCLFGTWGEGNAETAYGVRVTNQWQDVEINFTSAKASSSWVMLWVGEYAGTISVEKVSVYYTSSPLFYSYDYTGKGDPYPWYHDNNWGARPTVGGDILTAENESELDNPHDYQFFVADNIFTETGNEYIVRATMKGSVGGSITCGFGTWSSTQYATLSFTNEYQAVECKVSGLSNASNNHVLFQIGKYIGTIYLKKIEIIGNGRTIIVGDAGYTTFSTDKAIDVTGYVTAYGAKYDGSKIVLKEVAKIPANKGVVVEAAEDIYAVPTIASAESIDAVNDLLVSDGSATSNGTNYFALGKKDDKVGFMKVKNGVTIPKGKAYLYIAIPPKSRDFIGFDDETTGIESVKQQAKADNQYFNIAGQRVAQPTKGLYIVNGKKVIIK